MLDAGTAVVIEDDPEVGVLIQFVLEQAGWHVVVADDGAAGIEAVRQHEPVLVTLDVNLPGADGFAVARELRTFSDTYLIMVTGMVGEIDIIRGFDAGADDYLVKPFRPRELRARADAMMRRYQSWQKRPSPTENNDLLVGGVVDAPSPVASDPSWAALAVNELAATAAPVADGLPRTPEPLPVPVAAPVAASRSSIETAPAAVAAQATVVTLAAAASPAEPALLPAPPALLQTYENVLTLRDLVVQRDARAVRLGARSLSLSTVEFDLLVSLLESGRRVRSKAELALTMRGEGPVPTRFVNGAEKRRVDGFVADLRAKLDDDPVAPRYVETVVGVGYRMVDHP